MREPQNRDNGASDVWALTAYWNIEPNSTQKYYLKFPELYSRRINSLIITALKYQTEH